MFYGSLGFMRSSDRGIRWEALSFSNVSIRDFAVSRSGSLLGIETLHDKLYRSTDEGESWSLRDSSLDGNSFASIVFDEFGRLYAKSSFGVFLSDDEGLHWQNVTANLPFLAFSRSLTITADGHLYVGTRAEGVWRTLHKVTDNRDRSDPERSGRFELGKNYPNPFNGTTTISFSVAVVSHVVLSVYDILGREVRRIDLGIAEPGTHRAIFDGQSLASGVYLYTVEANQRVLTRTMHLVK
jgi:hypothetical protein